MNRIDKAFDHLSSGNKGAIIPFLMAGDPDIETSFLLASEVIRAGGDILELGIPFSDPVADGPVIQRAGQRALEAGTDIPAVLRLAGDIRSRCDAPLVLMTYYNPVYRYGEERFVGDSAAAGVDGLIVVDLPPEEGEELFGLAGKRGLASILMVSPTTVEDREDRIMKLAEGFIYCVSRRGTTGVRTDIPSDLRKKVCRLKKRTDIPVAVGFGLSTGSQVSEVLSFSDGAVVGSALVSAVERESDREARIAVAGSFIRKLRG